MVKIAVIGHAHANALNRGDFNQLAESADVTFYYPSDWRGSFNEQYKDSDGFRISKIPFIPNAYVPLIFNVPRYDVVWIDEEPVSPQTFFILNIFSNARVIIIRSAQNILKRNIYRDLMHKFTIKRCTQLTGVGFTSAKLLGKISGMTNIEIVPISIMNKYFEISKKRIFNINQKVKIGFAARLDICKGIYQLTEISKRLEFPFKLYIAGNGPMRDNLLDTLKLYNIDYEYSGFIKHENMDEFYGNIDIFLNLSTSTPNWEEQQGRSVIEAAASGAYVVSTDSGELHYVMDGLGYAIKENNTEKICKHLTFLNSNRNIFEQTNADNRKKCAIFSQREVGRKILSIVRQYE